MPIHSTYEKKFARVSAADDGDNTVITGTANKSIYVLGYALNANAAGVVTIQDSAGTPVVHASFELTDGGVVTYAGSEDAPAFKIAKGLNLEINNAAGVDALGHLTYILV